MSGRYDRPRRVSTFSQIPRAFAYGTLVDLGASGSLAVRPPITIWVRLFFVEHFVFG